MGFFFVSWLAKFNDKINVGKQEVRYSLGDRFNDWRVQTSHSALLQTKISEVVQRDLEEGKGWSEAAQAQGYTYWIKTFHDKQVNSTSQGALQV